MLHINEAQESANFLSIAQRYDEAIYDSYYCCNICGGFLSWIIDNEDVGVFQPGAREGTVSRVISNDITYVALLLAKQNRTGMICVDSVLIATQTNRSWRPTVICQGLNTQVIIDSRHEENGVPYLNEGESNAMTSLNTSCNTQIIVCRRNDTVLSWSRDDVHIISLNRSDIMMTNSHEFEVPSRAYQNVSYKALLLGGNGESLVSALFWVDFHLSGNLYITCDSRNETEPSSSTNVPTNPFSFSTGSLENTTAGPTSGYPTLSPCRQSQLL